MAGDGTAFAAFLKPLKTTRWFVYSKRPFAGPEAVLAYLSRYTHRVAISNSRLLRADDRSVTFKWKDYRFEGRERYKAMTLDAHESIRIHVLPKGLHRIHHYGLFANTARAENLARMRELLAVNVPPPVEDSAGINASAVLARPCPCCGARMRIIETFDGVCPPRRSMTPVAIRIDTS